MNIRELRKILKDYPDDTEVILQSDAEGNGYSPLSCSGAGYYIPENTWSGCVYDADWTHADADMESEEWEEIQRTVPRALILAPAN